MDKKKLIVVAMGGCGNRLFQLARAVDLTFRGSAVTLINIEEFTSLYWVLKKYWNWTDQPVWLDFEKMCNGVGVNIKKMSFFDRCFILKELVIIKFFRKKSRLNYTLDEDSRIYQIGYFQNENCVSVKACKIVCECLKEVINLDCCSNGLKIVHLRAGDYAEEDRLDKVNIENFIGNDECFCITNDPDYVYRNYKGLSIIGTDDPLKDFVNLASANVIYPSNSTYAFWACMLSTRYCGGYIWQLPRHSYWKILINILTCK